MVEQRTVAEQKAISEQIEEQARQARIERLRAEAQKKVIRVPSRIVRVGGEEFFVGAPAPELVPPEVEMELPPVIAGPVPPKVIPKKEPKPVPPEPVAVRPEGIPGVQFGTVIGLGEDPFRFVPVEREAITEFRTREQRELEAREARERFILGTQQFLEPSRITPEQFVTTFGPVGGPVLRAGATFGEFFKNLGITAVTEPQKLFVLPEEAKIDISAVGTGFQLTREAAERIARDPGAFAGVSAAALALLFAPSGAKFVRRGVGRTADILRRVEIDLGPDIPPGAPGRLRGEVRPRVRVKLKKKKVLTAKEFLAQQKKRALEPTEPPKITKVTQRGTQIELEISSGGRVVETRILDTRITNQAIIDAQLSAARLQGAKFVGVKAVTQPRLSLGGQLLLRQTRQIDALRSVVGTQLKRAALQDTATAKALGLVVTPAQIRAQRQRQRQISAVGQAQRQLEAQAQAQTSAISQASAQAQQQVQSQAQAQAQLQKQAQSQAQAQFQATAQAQAQAEAQAQQEAQAVAQGLEQITGRRVIPRARVRGRGIFGFGLPILPTRKKVKEKPTRKKAGYHAFVKRGNRAIRVTKKPRTRKTALSIGGSIVDNTPAASFTIKKADKVASGREIDTFKNIKNKFRQRRTKKALIVVEKRKFRLDSIGEKAGLRKRRKK